jgi:hypothetical protein
MDGRVRRKKGIAVEEKDGKATLEDRLTLMPVIQKFCYTAITRNLFLLSSVYLLAVIAS